MILSNTNAPLYTIKGIFALIPFFFKNGHYKINAVYDENNDYYAYTGNDIDNMIFVGLTALSVEINTNFSTPYLSAALAVL